MGARTGEGRALSTDKNYQLARVRFNQRLAEERTRICRSWCISVFSVSETVLSVAATAFRGQFLQFSAVLINSAALALEAHLGGFIRNEPPLGCDQWCVRVSLSHPVLEMPMAAEVK